MQWTGNISKNSTKTITFSGGYPKYVSVTWSTSTTNKGYIFGVMQGDPSTGKVMSYFADSSTGESQGEETIGTSCLIQSVGAGTITIKNTSTSSTRAMFVSVYC